MFACVCSHGGVYIVISVLLLWFYSAVDNKWQAIEVMLAVAPAAVSIALFIQPIVCLIVYGLSLVVYSSEVTLRKVV